MLKYTVKRSSYCNLLLRLQRRDPDKDNNPYNKDDSDIPDYPSSLSEEERAKLWFAPKQEEAVPNRTKKTYLSTDDRTAFLKRIPPGLHPHTLLQLPIFKNAVEFQFTTEFKRDDEKKSESRSGFLRFATSEEKQEALWRCHPQTSMMLNGPKIKNMRLHLLEHDPRSIIRIYEIPSHYCDSIESLQLIHPVFKPVVEVLILNMENDLCDLSLRFDNYDSRHKAKLLLFNHALPLKEPDGTESTRLIRLGYKMQAVDYFTKQWKHTQAKLVYRTKILHQLLAVIKQKVILKKKLTHSELQVIAYARKWNTFFDVVEEIDNLAEFVDDDELIADSTNNMHLEDELYVKHFRGSDKLV